VGGEGIRREVVKDGGRWKEKFSFERKRLCGGGSESLPPDWV
jgi:hypothetical protein